MVRFDDRKDGWVWSLLIDGFPVARSLEDLDISYDVFEQIAIIKEGASDAPILGGTVDD